MNTTRTTVRGPKTRELIPTTTSENVGAHGTEDISPGPCGIFRNFTSDDMDENPVLLAILRDRDEAQEVTP